MTTIGLVSARKIIQYYPVVLLSVCCLLLGLIFILTQQIKVQLHSEKLRKDVLSIQPSAYPVLTGAARPLVSAEGAVVLDSDSMVVLFVHNPYAIFPTASTAKIATALAALDYFAPTDILTIGDIRAEGSVVGVRRGEKFTFRDLLYALLLPSGNDIAQAIAGNYKGGAEDFVAAMNTIVTRERLASTHFSEPTGLDAVGNYTTPFDLARLGRLAMGQRSFAEVVGTKQKTIASVGGRVYFLSNLNKLLDLQGVDGVKTGFTEEAGGVLVTSYNQNGHEIIIVVMRSADRFADTVEILNFIKQNIVYVQPKLLIR